MSNTSPSKRFYFDKFEDRRPEPPLPYSHTIEMLWQLCAAMACGFGCWYIIWRWTSSINTEALWYSIPLVVAETGAFIGLLLFIFNLWRTEDIPQQSPPKSKLDVVPKAQRTASSEFHKPIHKDRPLTVDIFITTFDEDPELVELSLIDAKNVRYPHDIRITIHLLDDGRRQTMADLAAKYDVNHITRDNNIGFKAGNLRNAMEHTYGDFIVILDADTRPFPTLLENTLGYFRDPDVAWVQTPQWFFDLPEGKSLPEKLGNRFGKVGKLFGQTSQKIFGEIQVGYDPLVNDPKLFFDIIQRRRNRANASFCCGAGSIHRREAVMQVALRNYANAVTTKTRSSIRKVLSLTKEHKIHPDMVSIVQSNSLEDIELTPYKFHVSEDMFTSLVLHSDKDRNWKSVLHPPVECKMLSPQDLLTWTIQRYKYAGGTLDIGMTDNPITKKGLSFSQRLMYLSTFWSYLGGIWNVIFLVAPIIYLFTAISPVTAYTLDFYKSIFPFLITMELAFMFGTWGIDGYQSKASYLSFFPLNLKAIWKVLRRKQIKFAVTPKVKQSGNFVSLVIPQILIIIFTTIGCIYATWQYLYVHNNDYQAGGILINFFWGLNNIIALSGIIRAATLKTDNDTDNNND
jgi:cellulose synthase (UDP-forming)